MRTEVYVWGNEAAEQYLVGRVRRALPATTDGLGCVEYIGFSALGAKLLAAAGPVWLLSAGAWPADAGRVRIPPPSATGRPLMARGNGTNDATSIYLEPPLVAALGQLLSAGMPWDAALALLQGEHQPRSVGFAPLRVEWDSRLRVLQVVTSLQRGGAERVALDLATQLPKSGVTCRIATIGGPTRETFEVPADHLDLSRYRGDRKARAEALKCAAIAFGADVVHAHLLDAEDALLLKDSGIPLVMTIHNQRLGWPAGFEKLTAPCATLLAACSQTVERELQVKFPGDARSAMPIRTVWNGIDFDAINVDAQARKKAAALRKSVGFAREDFVLLSLANPRPQKRLDRLPGIIAATKAAFAQAGIEREVRLIFCGEHRQGNIAALEAVAHTNAEIERLGLEEKIRWIGSVADVASVLAASDVLVSTSAFEGLSLAQLEALAAGLPIVLTNVGGARDIGVGNPEVTILPVDSSSEQYAEALLNIALNKPAGGREAARKHFTQVQMAERYRWLYPRAIAAHGRPQRRGGLWLITNNFSTGGAQSSAKRLLKALRQQGIPVRACVLQEQDTFPTPGRQELEAAGIRVLALPRAGTIDVSTAVSTLLAEIDADPPAAVLCWNALAPYKLLLAEGLLDIPLFDVSPGEMYFSSLERYFQNPLAALPYRTPRDYGARLAGMIVKFEGEAELARATLGCPVHVVPNGVGVDSLSARAGLSEPARGEKLVIGTAARLSPQKKLEELLGAVRRAHSRLPKYVLRIAGGPEPGSEAYAANLRRLALGLPVEWAGELTDVGSFLGGLNLFVMISEPSGCPNASLEALAAGLPVVATDFGGVREQIEHGVSGLLTPRGDTAALADAIVAVAADGTLRERLRQGGLERVRQKFSLERMVADYRRICFGPS